MKHSRRLFATLGLSAAVVGMSGLLAAFGPAQDARQGAAQQEVEVKIGEKAPNFTLTDMQGKEHSLSDFKGKTVVIEWTNPDCPYVVGVYREGVVKKTMESLKETFGDNSVYFAINSSADKAKEDVIKGNIKFLETHKAKLPVLIDHDGKVGRMYKATRTPEMLVICADGVLRYRGAFTDDSRFRDNEGHTNYVINALKQMKAGETVAPDTTRAWGCTVKYASK